MVGLLVEFHTEKGAGAAVLPRAFPTAALSGLSRIAGAAVADVSHIWGLIGVIQIG